jgi:hypothetical protein
MNIPTYVAISGCSGQLIKTPCVRYFLLGDATSNQTSNLQYAKVTVGAYGTTPATVCGAGFGLLTEVAQPGGYLREIYKKRMSILYGLPYRKVGRRNESRVSDKRNSKQCIHPIGQIFLVPLFLAFTRFK